MNRINGNIIFTSSFFCIFIIVSLYCSVAFGQQSPPGGGPASMQSSPPDVTPYSRGKIPEDVQPGGKPAIPPGLLIAPKKPPTSNVTVQIPRIFG